MAYFKRRRGSQGPNKNEQKVIRAKKEEYRARSGGVVGAKFPSVKNLRIQLTFLDARQQVLEEKKLDFPATAAAIFTASCPGRCGQGTFDFEPTIADAVSGGQAAFEGSLNCLETLFAGSTEACCCELRCKMEIEYFPSATVQA